MSVDPFKSDALPQEPSAASRGAEDRAEEASEVPHGTLPPERMHTVLRRLADGYYDRPEVREELARRLRHDVANSSRTG